jgi:hypothetical protein
MADIRQICGSCGGTGEVLIAGTIISCPACFGVQKVVFGDMPDINDLMDICKTTLAVCEKILSLVEKT